MHTSLYIYTRSWVRMLTYTYYIRCTSILAHCVAGSNGGSLRSFSRAYPAPDSRVAPAGGPGVKTLAAASSSPPATLPSPPPAWVAGQSPRGLAAAGPSPPPFPGFAARAAGLCWSSWGRITRGSTARRRVGKSTARRRVALAHRSRCGMVLTPRSRCGRAWIWRLEGTQWAGRLHLEGALRRSSAAHGGAARAFGRSGRPRSSERSGNDLGGATPSPFP